MKRLPWLAAASAVLAMVACHPTPASDPTASATPVPADENAKAVLGFLGAYGRRDLDGMMKYLDEEAVFRGTGAPLSKAQIRDFFQASFRKHLTLKVEAGPLRAVQGTIQVSVRVETDAIWTDTWIFEMRNHRIHAYSLASAKR